MDYNSSLEELIMPEYGRNVQRLVQEALLIEPEEKQRAFCEEIVTLIQHLYPQSKNIEDYREKLWKHLYKISDYKLVALPPSGERPKPEDERKKPEQVPYPVNNSRFRHYGSNVLALIKRAIDMEDNLIKEGFVHTIGSYMKLAYKTWNREHYVSDDIIKGDLMTLSGGKLNLEDHYDIDGLSNAGRNKNNPLITNRNNMNPKMGMNMGINNGGNNNNNRGNNGGNNNRPNNGGNNNRPNNGGNNGNNNNNNRRRK